VQAPPESGLPRHAGDGRPLDQSYGA
jgi:hypothetical protein